MGAGGSAASAGLGQAASVGGLSVPPAWTAAAPAIRLAAVALPATGLGAAPEVAAAGIGSPWAEMALAGMAGRAISGTVGLGRPERIGVTTRAYPAPPQRSPGGPVTGIAAELRELAELHDSGILTDQEFSEQKRRLLA